MRARTRHNPSRPKRSLGLSPLPLLRLRKPLLQRLILLPELRILLLQVRDILGRLAQNRRLVKLARGHQPAELLDNVNRLVALGGGGGGLRVFGVLDDAPQRGDGVAEGNDFLVDVDAVALLNHVVRIL